MEITNELRTKLSIIYNHFSYVLDKCVKIKSIDFLDDYLKILNEINHSEYVLNIKQSETIISLNFYSNLNCFSDIDLIHHMSFFIKKLEFDNLELAGFPSLIKIDKGKFRKQEIEIEDKPYVKKIKYDSYCQ